LITIHSLASSSQGNAYLLKDGKAPAPMLLLEAGLPFRELQKRLWQEGATISALAGCLISHEHGDHAKGATELALSGVDIFTSPGTRAELLTKGPKLIQHRVHSLYPRQAVKVYGWDVMPFETIHDAAEPYGFLIARDDDRLAYITDTAYVPVRFQGLTAIMVECNYAINLLTTATKSHPEMKKRVIKNHFGLDQVKKFLAANDLSAVREIWLLHLSEAHSDAARFKTEIQCLTGKPVYVAAK
jgi:phosphoribosyl 1,2-cyclic phosphodiesterase